jgi:hypothetical protein
VGDAYAFGRWDDARRLSDEFLAETEKTGTPHYMEHAVRQFRALMAAAEDDLDRAREEATTALGMARDARDPQAVIPALITGAYVDAVAGLESEAASLFAEALEADERGIFVVGVGVATPWVADRLGLLDGLRELAAKAAPRSPWVEALDAYLAGDLARAADAYADIGALPDAAWTRLAAAERLTDAGRYAEAEQHLAQPLAFYRSVGATGYVRRGEALLRASA